MNRYRLDAAGRQWVPPGRRMAAFDRDGTPRVEPPMYPQGIFALDRVKDVARAQPGLGGERRFVRALAEEVHAIPPEQVVARSGTQPNRAFTVTPIGARLREAME